MKRKLSPPPTKPGSVHRRVPADQARCVLINLDTNLHTNSSIIVPSAFQYPIVQVLTARRTAVSVGRVLFLTAESVDLGVATERFPGDTLNTVVVVGRTTNVLL